MVGISVMISGANTKYIQTAGPINVLSNMEHLRNWQFHVGSRLIHLIKGT
jgi:hypothetical protein